jgi:hypothetical protein
VINLYFEKFYDETRQQILKEGFEIDNTKEIIGTSVVRKKLTLAHVNEVNKFIKLQRIQKPEERFEYAEIYHTLRNTIRKKLFYFKNQTKTSRQFIYHSDSCISTFQLLYRDNKLYSICYMRSSDLCNMLPNDLKAIYEMTLDLNKEFFNAKEINSIVYIGSLHIKNE